MKFIASVASLVMGIILFTGCQSSDDAQVEIKMKSNEEQKEIADTYTYDDYKKVFEEAVSEANKFDEDEELTKWIIRTLAQEKLYYETDLTDEQVKDSARKDMEEDKVWKSIATEDYGVSVTETEVDNYINEGPDSVDSPQMKAYADALGLSIEELNHDFDRDLYEKNVLWLKLKPKLEKKYGTNDNNEQVEKYEEEVAEQLN
ncbi:hypothetical protein ACOJQI_12125 [Bacillus salacetis]|uniref:hypothetical protein n=1 Tax=Bacillus salacetis TaxID=2315464 RepID=UPI003BA0E312